MQVPQIDMQIIYLQVSNHGQIYGISITVPMKSSKEPYVAIEWSSAHTPDVTHSILAETKIWSNVPGDIEKRILKQANLLLEEKRSMTINCGAVKNNQQRDSGHGEDEKRGMV